MVRKKRTSLGDIKRIHIDRRQREGGYVMSSHHCHPYYELCCIEHGACRFMLEDRMYDLHVGDLLLIPPQVVHYTRYLFGSCRRIGIYFRDTDLDGAVTALLPGRETFFSRVQVFHVPEAFHAACCELLSRMAYEEQTDDSRSPLILHLQLMELLAFCSRVCSFLEDNSLEIRTADRQVLAAAHYINEHFRQQISSADIAAAAGFSPNYLSRKFREAAGIGLHEYLVLVRLRSAALELVSTDMSVTEIATHCGFSDGNYFKDVFKRKYGVSPRDYRNAAKG